MKNKKLRKYVVYFQVEGLSCREIIDATSKKEAKQAFKCQYTETPLSVELLENSDF